jgi:hypothetical protein
VSGQETDMVNGEELVTRNCHDEQWECGMEELGVATRGDAQRSGTRYDGGGKQQSDDSGEMLRQQGDTYAE